LKLIDDRLEKYFEGYEVEEKMENKLNKLLELNVNNFTKKKGKLTYLSWARAWREFLKVYPDATYNIKKNENGTPEFGNAKFGYMVFTDVTVEGITREMWLPVMDGANKAMKDEPYTHKVKEYKNYKPTGNMIDKTVAAMSMFDVNKAVMRCLTKNLAMDGLGLYIYAGEDLPEEPEETPAAPKKPIKKVELAQTKIKALYTLADAKGKSSEDVKALIKKNLNIDSTKDLTLDQYNTMVKWLRDKPDKESDK